MCVWLAEQGAVEESQRQRHVEDSIDDVARQRLGRDVLGSSELRRQEPGTRRVAAGFARRPRPPRSQSLLREQRPAVAAAGLVRPFPVAVVVNVVPQPAANIPAGHRQLRRARISQFVLQPVGVAAR